MVLIDGFRNCRCWHRLCVYLFYIIKAFTLIARTLFDSIDENLYPESTVWLRNHPKQTKIIDNVDRFGWYFVGIIALISIFKVFGDPKHQYFIMKMDKLSRDEVINIINDNDNKRRLTKLNASPNDLLSPIVDNNHRHHKRSKHRRKSSIKSSVIASHGGELVVEVEEDDVASGVHSSLITDGTSLNASGLSNEYGGFQYGHRTLLKMDL